MALARLSPMADPRPGPVPFPSEASSDARSSPNRDPSSSTGSGGLPSLGPDWTDEVVNRIEGLAVAIRTKTADPAAKITRILVYGFVAAILGAIALIFLVIAILRLHVYLPFSTEERKVWVTYAGLGAIFLVLGMFLWRKRKPRKVKR